MRTSVPVNVLQLHSIIGAAERISAAYVRKNDLVVDDVPVLVGRVAASLRAALLGIDPNRLQDCEDGREGSRAADKEERDRRREALPTIPAVPIDESVQPDHVICLFDGVRRVSLKRYVRQKYGMEEREYRDHWGLPDDYPLVAPNYRERTRVRAITQGLGRTIDRGASWSSIFPAAPARR